MFSDLLPNIASTVLVFFTLIIATNILTEAGLSFLGAGVQPPESVVGNPDRRRTGPDPRPRRGSRSSPGIAIVLTVLSLNIFGDGLRDAPRPARQA